MRVRTVLVTGSALLLLSVSPAFAKPKAKTASPPTESASARAARLALADDVGERKDVDLHAPAMQNGKVTTGEATVDRAPEATAAPVRPDGPLSGVVEELVARQMTHNRTVQAAVDVCLSEAKSWDSHFSGVELTVRVVNKEATFAAPPSTKQPEGDPALWACLGGIRGLKLSIPDQAFSWRFSLSDHREMATR